MAVKQNSRWCPSCQRDVLHQRTTFSEGWGCLLTILTGGLFILLWAPLIVIQFFTEGWVCQICGRKN